MDAVELATSLTAPLDVAGILQVAQDAVRVTLGDACSRRDLSHADVRLLSNGEQYLGVIRDERPTVRRDCLTQLSRRPNRLGHSNSHAAYARPSLQSAKRLTSR